LLRCDRRRIGLMNPGIGFLNIGRAGSVDHLALVDALCSSALSGAILDVHDPEPLPSSSPLWHVDNIIPIRTRPPMISMCTCRKRWTSCSRIGAADPGRTARQYRRSGARILSEKPVHYRCWPAEQSNEEVRNARDRG
jgi:hypothetical protein